MIRPYIFLLGHNHFLPFDIPEYRYYHVKRVKACFERYFLIEIKSAGDHVDGDPDEPLLEIFVSQCPNSDDAQGRREAVGNWHGAVSEIAEYQIDSQPHQCDDSKPRKYHFLWEMTYWQFFFLGRAVNPFPITVDGHCEVIKLHSAVGVESFLIVKNDSERLHHEADEPHPNAGPIFENNIGESEDCGDNVEPVFGDEFHIIRI